MTDAEKTEQLISEPAVRDLAETIVRRLDAGIVDADVYLAEMRETLQRKRDAIGEAFVAGELREEDAENGSRIAEQQIELVDGIIRGRAHDALPADEHPYEIKVGLTGDTAEADTAEDALAAAAQLVRDAHDGIPIQGRIRAARDTILISHNGRYDGALTEIARHGITRLDALAEGRS